MNAQEVLELVRAGFSRQEILNLVDAPAVNAGAPAPDDPLPDPAPTGDATQEPAEVSSVSAAADANESRFTAIESALKEVTAALQAAAIRQTEQPTKTLSLEDAMEGIFQAYN